MSEKILTLIVGLWSYCGLSQNIQLSKPRANLQMAMVSKDEVKLLEYDFRMEKAEIRYTIDGSEPVKNSKLYLGPIQISQPCTVKAKTFHPDFEASENSITTFILKGEKPLILRATEANDKYNANGMAALIDGTFGAMSFDANYLGYDIDVVEIMVKVDSSKYLTSFNLAYLVNQQAWIFGPQRIKIFENDKLIVEKVFDDADQQCDVSHKIISMILPANKYNFLKIMIEPLSSMPSWHPGKGKKAWFFTDEIWFY